MSLLHLPRARLNRRGLSKGLEMRLSTALLALSVAVTAVPAQAQPTSQPDNYVRLGGARIKLADDGDIFVNGALVPGGGYRTPEDWILSAEFGRFVLDKVAVQVSATSPATTSNVPTGTLAGLPSLGDDTFSLFTLTGVYHPLRGRPVSPYVGAGVAWHHTWDTDDGFASNLRIGDDLGPVVQAGVEVAVTPVVGVYLEARQAFITVGASGDLGPAAVTADAELDPFIVQAGVLLRF